MNVNQILNQPSIDLSQDRLAADPKMNNGDDSKGVSYRLSNHGHEVEKTVNRDGFISSLNQQLRGLSSRLMTQ